jgi:hypothetical protein
MEGGEESVNHGMWAARGPFVSARARGRRPRLGSHVISIYFGVGRGCCTAPHGGHVVECSLGINGFIMRLLLNSFSLWLQN